MGWFKTVKEEEYERGVKAGLKATGLDDFLHDTIGTIVPTSFVAPEAYGKGYEYGRTHRRPETVRQESTSEAPSSSDSSSYGWYPDVDAPRASPMTASDEESNGSLLGKIIRLSIGVLVVGAIIGALGSPTAAPVSATSCRCCQHGQGFDEPRTCPECSHVFRGSGWNGIDAHWRSRHEALMTYDHFWSSLCARHRGSLATVG